MAAVDGEILGYACLQAFLNYTTQIKRNDKMKLEMMVIIIKFSVHL
jgi:hypothetical protein